MRNHSKTVLAGDKNLCSSLFLFLRIAKPIAIRNRTNITMAISLRTTFGVSSVKIKLTPTRTKDTITELMSNAMNHLGMSSKG